MVIEPLNDRIGRLINPPKRLRPFCRPRGLLLGGDEPKAERRNATERKADLNLCFEQLRSLSCSDPGES
jgi:hypothetical protein